MQCSVYRLIKMQLSAIQCNMSRVSVTNNAGSGLDERVYLLLMQMSSWVVEIMFGTNTNTCPDHFILYFFIFSNCEHGNELRIL
jgi:hexokinase